MARLLLVPMLLFVVPASGWAQGLDHAYKEAASLSTDEKLARAGVGVDGIRDTHQAALVRLQAASEKQDILQLNCVRDKMAAIKGLLKIAEQADVSLKEAAVKRDEELINHEYTKISIASARAENYRVEVEECVGEASQYTGQTILEVNIEGDERSDDPTDEPLADMVDFIQEDKPVDDPDEFEIEECTITPCE